MTGALYIPGADRTSRWFYDDFPNAAMAAIDKSLLHSTETQKSSGCPGYSGGSTAPQVTINPWPGYQRIWQHFPIIRPGRALGNPSSTPVSENKDNVFQVEIIGFSDPALGRRYNCYLPELPDEGLTYLAKMLAFVHEEWPHPLTIPTTWPLYKVSSYAAMDAAHMTSTQYDRFEGILAHLHAPKPSSHGDVAINIKALVRKVDAILNPPVPPVYDITSGETDMQFFHLQDPQDTSKQIGPVIASDGFRMRALSATGWARIKASIKQQTGREPQSVGVLNLSGVALTWVGPKPSADYPIPSGVTVVSEA